MAFGLLALVFAATTPLIITTVRGNAYARHISEATALARDKLEQLRGVNAGSLVGGADPSPLTAAGQSGGAPAMYSRNWVVSAGPAAPAKRVAVTVSWTDHHPHQVTLDTLIAK